MITQLLNILSKLSESRKRKDSQNEPIPSYNYYEIKYNTSFSQKLKRTRVVKALLETGMFKQKDHQTFTSKKNFPWSHILIVETQDGNYSSSDRINQFVTLIAIVCHDEYLVEQDKYIPTFLQIAQQLNWKLFLTRDVDSNENVEITQG